ncbi:HEAT repeat domain-containing protein [Halonotius terrestris]|uniref:HEAT repeat domain-containing protein n=1 Tax=Halonotius terrestris TaxID=2487750 RepID=A0A8J8TCR2_9EURY|nr:HEAT repeat domain-containing protein [Halonotius terrestris]TQQ81279.1 HEAT repeat domain-containing protein [Halonotius terrestris]
MSLYDLARDGDAEGLREMLLESDSPAVRKRACELLGEIADTDDADTVESLVSVAVTDDVEAVRAAAVDGLDQIGTEAVEQLLSEITGQKIEEGADWAVAKRFAKALNSDIPELRMAAASALGKLGDESAVSSLTNALSDNNSKVRVRVCLALGMIGHASAVPALIDRLSDPSGRVREEAAVALSTIGTDQALAALTDMMDSNNDSIRRVAANALGEAGTADVVEPLANALTDPNTAVRSAAVYSILELLSNVPTQKSHQIRDRIVAELQDADEATVQPIVEILEESSQKRQRRNAAWFLGRIVEDPDRKTIEVLVEALESDDMQTSQFAATSLAEIGGEKVETELIDLVKSDAAADARAQGVFVLGKIGGERSSDVVSNLTDDDSKQVRKRAFSAVSKLKGRQ